MKIKIILFLLFSVLILHSIERDLGEVQILSVSHNGFEENKITTLTVNVFIDFYGANDDCKMWIEPENPMNWDLYNDESTPMYYLGSSLLDNAVNTLTLHIRSNNVSQISEILKIHFTIGDDLLVNPLENRCYNLKVVVDKPFELLSESEQTEVAEKYLPVLLFDKGLEGGVPEEIFFPIDVDAFLDYSEIIRRELVSGIYDPDILICSDPTKDSIAIYNESFTLFLDLIPENGYHLEFNQDPFSFNQNNYNRQIYFSLFDDIDNDTQTEYVVLTYWFFYLYNSDQGFQGNYNHHFGDWEGFSILFSKDDIVSNYQTAKPISIATSSHMKSGKFRSWRNALRIQNHPVLFVCNGSHATYFNHGISLNDPPSPFTPCLDYHMGDGKWLYPRDLSYSDTLALVEDYDLTFSEIIFYGNQNPIIQTELLPRLNSIDELNMSDYWHQFGGNWGQSSNLGIADALAESNSPSGPPFIESKDRITGEKTNGYKWFNPYIWHDSQEYETASYLIADFYSDETNLCNQFTIYFYNFSSTNATTYMWDFENDGQIDSYEASPNHTYLQTGNYDVLLSVNDGVNTITKLKENYISIVSLESNFSANPTTVDIYENVFFTDQSTAGATNIESWYWDFENDGVYDSFEQNPAHYYSEAGIYDVKLKITNGTVVDSLIQYDYITINSAPPPDPDDIVAIEFFFDTDPGFGNGVSIPIIPADSITVQTTLDVSNLVIGLHRLYLRAKDENGIWGIPQSKPVLVQLSSPTDPLPDIVDIEYFFDTDPGLGGGTSLSFTPADIVEIIANLDVSSLEIGLHRLYVRAQNENGIWGIVQSKPVLVQITGPGDPLPNIVSVEYFIGSEPGFGNGTPLSFTPDSLVTINANIPLESYEIGEYILYVRALDENGVWGIPQHHVFTVSEMLTIPQNLSLVSNGSTVTITWDPVDGANSYRVYSSDEPYAGYELDETGVFNETSWTVTNVYEKRFYHVTAHSDLPDVVRSKSKRINRKRKK